MNLNPFKGDTHESYNSGTGQYRAPIAGYYQVAATVYKYVPTGKFEWQENHSRKWYQFWKPKLTYREVYEMISSDEGTKTIFAQRGEALGTKIEMRRIK